MSPAPRKAISWWRRELRSRKMRRSLPQTSVNKNETASRVEVVGKIILIAAGLMAFFKKSKEIKGVSLLLNERRWPDEWQ